MSDDAYDALIHGISELRKSNFEPDTIYAGEDAIRALVEDETYTTRGADGEDVDEWDLHHGKHLGQVAGVAVFVDDNIDSNEMVIEDTDQGYLPNAEVTVSVKV